MLDKSRSWEVKSRPGQVFRLPGLGWRALTYALIVALFATDERLSVLYADCSYPSNPSFEATRITQFEYDNDGHLTRVNAPEGVVNYGYDLATGRHNLTCSANSEVAYGYDQLGRLQDRKSVV